MRILARWRNSCGCNVATYLRTVHGTEVEWRLCLGGVATSIICSRLDAPAFSWDGAWPTGTKKARLAGRRDARRTRRSQPPKPRRGPTNNDALPLWKYQRSRARCRLGVRSRPPRSACGNGAAENSALTRVKTNSLSSISTSRFEERGCRFEASIERASSDPLCLWLFFLALKIGEREKEREGVIR